MSAQLQKAAESFEKLNPREQRLAIAVAALVALFAVFGIVRYALESLAMLDSQINRLQQTLLNVDNQIRHRESIEEQYARVASQHSSNAQNGYGSARTVAISRRRIPMPA